MINYEGISYNLDAIIQFEALKKLLEVLAKKQIEYNILLYGQNKEMKSINNENKDEKIDVGEEKTENSMEKINNIGIINDYIESKQQIIQNTKIINELKSRVELLEQKEIKESKINNYVEKEEKIKNIENKNNEIVNDNEKNNVEKKDKDASVTYITTKKYEDKNEGNSLNNIIIKDNKDYELNNINIKKNEIVLHSNEENKEIIKNNYTILKEEEINLKNEIDSLENKLKMIKTQIEKIHTLAENNKISIDVSKKEMPLFKKMIEKFSDDNFIDNNKLELFEKKIIKIIEIKVKELISSKFENFNVKTFIMEKDKLKEEIEKILLDINNIKNKNIDLENKLAELPDTFTLQKYEEKIKLFGLELEEFPTKNDIKHICNELDKFESEISKLKSFVVSQKEINAKYREDILKIKNSFENIKKTFSSINKLFENHSLSQMIDNLNILSTKMVEKEEHNNSIKEIKKLISDLKIDINDHNRILAQIMPIIQKILTMEDLNKLENSITDLIEKQNVDAEDKFANKKEIIKSIQSMESQVKLFMKNLEELKEKEKNEGVMLASKPVGGYKCASCEAYIGELKDTYTYLPWNKIHGTEKPYRLGSSFSRILQGLNIDNTFNPFIQKSKDSDKKYKLSENCMSIKKVRKIAPLLHVNSDIDVIKRQSFDEPLENDIYNYNRRNVLKNKVNIWGIKTIRNFGEINILNNSKEKVISLSKKNLYNKENEKTVKVSNRVFKSKVNNTTEVIEN